MRGLSLGGDTLWEVPWTNGAGVNAAVPIARGDDVFFSSGYGTGSAVVSVERRTGPAEDDTSYAAFEAAERWTAPNRFKLKFNDAILHEGYVYGLDEGILSSVEFATGDRKWKRGRYGYGQCLLLGDVLLVTCEDGDLVLVTPSPDRAAAGELARYSAAAGETLLDGTCWNHVAYSNGRLYWRNGAEAVCVELPMKGTPAAVAAK